MKFFSATQISNSHSPYWVYLDDVQDILAPFHQLFDLYSMHHIQQPKSDAPNISVSDEETPFEEFGKFDLLAFSPRYSHLTTVGTQHECEHDPYLQHPLRFEHSHYYISELSNLEFVVVNLLVKRDNDTWSPIQDEQTFYLHYGSFFDILPYCKTKKFIETKVAAMDLQGFNR